jgi:hypothetical protein
VGVFYQCWLYIPFNNPYVQASGGPTKAMIYESYPLDASKSEIRVLEILSAAGSSPQSYEICLRFHVVLLLEEPDYCALSYVWGDPDMR